MNSLRPGQQFLSRRGSSTAGPDPAGPSPFTRLWLFWVPAAWGAHAPSALSPARGPWPPSPLPSSDPEPLGLVPPPASRSPKHVRASEPDCAPRVPAPEERSVVALNTSVRWRPLLGVGDTHLSQFEGLLIPLPWARVPMAAQGVTGARRGPARRGR